MEEGGQRTILGTVYAEILGAVSPKELSKSLCCAESAVERVKALGSTVTIVVALGSFLTR
jgi:hypothetical protein